MAAVPTSGAVERAEREQRRFTTGGILLGIGFGGFVDGIVLHQLLQWHHMHTSTGEHPATTVAGLEDNTLWDGLFHVSTWIAAFVGILLLTQAMRAGYRAAGRCHCATRRRADAKGRPYPRSRVAALRRRLIAFERERSRPRPSALTTRRREMILRAMRPLVSALPTRSRPASAAEA